MAKFTREDSLYMARRALYVEKQHQEYTIIIGGDNNFNHIKWRVFPINIQGGDGSIEEFKKFLGNNIITFTSEELSRSMENTHTIKGLALENRMQTCKIMLTNQKKGRDDL